MSVIKSNLVLLALLMGLALSHLHGHKCIHDDVQRRIPKHYNNPDQVLQSSGRVLQLGQSPEERQYRIFVDYYQADTFVKNNDKYAARDNVSKRLMDATAKYSMEMLRVKSVENFSFDGLKCNDIQIPAFNKKADLYVLINTIGKKETEAFATAVACSQENGTNRPNVGIYDLNLEHIVDSKMNLLLYFSTFTHEFAHILFFNNDMYHQFKRPDGSSLPKDEVMKSGQQFAGESRDLIVLKDLVAFARQYFNDPNLAGLPLENGGGSGSAGAHWEKTFMPAEFLNPSVEYPAFISEFTLRFMRETGWYANVDLGYAVHYNWGKGQATYMSNTCPTTIEYCTNPGDKGCSPDFMSKTTCSGFQAFMGNCKYKKNNGRYCTRNKPDENQPDSFETYGASSRCFMWGNTPRCNTATCDANKVVTITIPGNKTAVCDSPGKLISLEGQTINCPINLDTFCSYLGDACPDDCTGNGICMKNKKCFCITGYSGDKCEVQSMPDQNASVPIPKPDDGRSSSFASLIGPLWALLGTAFLASFI